MSCFDVTCISDCIDKKSKRKSNNYGGIENNPDDLEFGGTIGTLALIIWSHYILFYFWYCYETASGQIIIPTSGDELSYHLNNFKNLVEERCVPSLTTCCAYFAFFFIQLLLAALLPGLEMKGLPTSEGKQLSYFCNGYECYYFFLLCMALFHYLDIYNITHISDHYGEYLMCSVIIGDITSIFWYFYGLCTTEECDASYSGSAIYDFFMGTVLYPRIGKVDIKMVAECRWSWVTLAITTYSCAMKQYETRGYVSKEMCVMVLAHWLYSNATVKGEHYIPGTWDMFHEKFGWMLNFWNIAGVPYLYCFQSYYILKNQDAISAQLSTAFVCCVGVGLCIGYYIFDSANQQKASYKITVNRKLFPQVLMYQY